MSQLTDLAEVVGVDARTLRRAANLGTLRAERLSPRKLRLAPGEEGYLRRYWKLLFDLRAALRTEPNVSFALLFGSVARGDDEPESDVDVLVVLRDNSLGRFVDLETRLRRTLGREIHVVDMEVAERNELLLSMAVEDGRVLVDREELWPSLWSEADELRERGERSLAESRRDALDVMTTFLS
jgi:predicted nucleotidyltransferase